MDSNDENDEQEPPIQPHMNKTEFKDYIPSFNVAEKFLHRNEAIKTFHKFDWNMASVIDHLYLDYEIPSPGKAENNDGGIRVSRMKPEIKLADPVEVRKVMYNR